MEPIRHSRMPGKSLPQREQTVQNRSPEAGRSRIRRHKIRSATLARLRQRSSPILPKHPHDPNVRLLSKAQTGHVDANLPEPPVKEAEDDLPRLSNQQRIDARLQGGHQEVALPKTNVRRQVHPVGSGADLLGSRAEERHEARARLRGGNARPPPNTHGGLSAVSGDRQRLLDGHPEILHGAASRGENDTLLDGRGSVA